MQILFYERRDKTFVEIIATANNNFHDGDSKIVLSIDDIAHNLSFEKKIELEELFDKRRMHWEMFVGNFASVNDFKNRMLKKGIKSVPQNVLPKFINQKEFFEFQQKKISKTMIQKKQS
jgi:hypothetical protein